MADAEKKEEEEEGDLKMKYKLISKKENIAKFLFEETDYTKMNYLRRTLMFDVPVMAIEDVYFTKNTSPLYDEIVAQRLGLIPLSTDLATYNMPDFCKCKGKGCAKCQVKLSLAEKGPKTVYAKDLKTTDPNVKPIYPNMIITKLAKDHEIVLEGVAVLGTGSEHVKWSPALVYYIHKPEVKINLKEAQKHKSKILEATPSNVIKETSGKLTIDNEILLNNDLAIEQINYVADKFNGIDIEDNESKFILTIESWGQLSPGDMLKKASEIGVSKINSAKIK